VSELKNLRIGWEAGRPGGWKAELVASLSAF